MKFDAGCWYDYENNDSNDLNKVFGFGGMMHQKRSARFAWRPNFEQKGKLKVYAYVYDNGERKTEFIGDVNTQDSVEFILKKSNNYIFTLAGKKIEIPMNGRNPSGVKFYPYFGGNNKAPNNMVIEINK